MKNNQLDKKHKGVSPSLVEENDLKRNLKKKKRKEVLLFFVLFVYPANVFNRFQQFFHWLGKTAIIAIDMTKWNQNFFGGCVAVLFVRAFWLLVAFVILARSGTQRTFIFPNIFRRGRFNCCDVKKWWIRLLVGRWWWHQ